MHQTSPLRRLFVALIAMSIVSGTLVAMPAYAQQQNEIILSVDFDGTPGFGDPLDDGSGNGVHTPGDDGGPNNNVVRTNDQVQYRIDWNVNEADGSAVTVRMTLPVGVTWLADPTTATGVPPGCAGGSITGNGGRDLVCITDAEFEGSNGAIHPRALVGALLDGDSLTPTASVETAEQPPTVSNTVPITVSARPKGNWVKGEEITDAVSGDTIGYKPNEEIFNVDNGGENGRIFVYNLRLIPAGGLKGAEPMNDAIPIQFFDHMWYTSNDAVLATGLMPNGRSACGGYDGDGTFPYGTAGLGAGNQTTAGTWTCTDISAAAGYGYPLIQIDIAGHNTSNPPPQNADGSGNADTLISGQVAFWISEADLSALPNPRFIVNAISGDDSEIDLAGSVPTPITVHGTNGPVPEASDTLDNNSPYEFPAGPPSSTPGRSFRHWVKYLNGPPQLVEGEDPNTGLTFLGHDWRSTGFGGTGYGVTDGANSVNAGNWWRWDGDGQVPRGNEMLVTAHFSTVTTRSTTPNTFAEAIHGCVNLDTTHQEIIPMPASLNVSTVDPHPTVPNLTLNRATIGGYATAPSPEGGGLANVIAGPSSTTASSWWAHYGAIVNNRGIIPHVVEYAAGIVTPGNAVAEHGATCNGGDADGRGWVDGATGNLSVFDPNGDGRYEDITHVRVRVLEDLPWHGDAQRSVISMGHAFQINLHVRVKDNPAAGFQEADQELFVYASRARGAWDGTGQPPTASCTNGAAFTGGSDTNVPTGWCNKPFTDDGANSTDVTDFKNDFDSSSVEFADTAARPRIVHADSVYIVEPALAISKANLDGAADIVVNGDIVEFEVRPKVVGSSLDVIADVTMSDPLSANYDFVAFTQLPSTPGASCTGGSSISCSFGTHPGGWSDVIRYQVKVTGAGANKTLRNTATLRGNDPLAGTPKTPASSSANSFTPAPFEESAIVKVLNNHIGPCQTHPTDDPTPVDWSARCEVIAQNSGMLFELTAINEGNVPLDNYRLIDVFPYNGDGTEPTSATLVGDGRSPASAFAGTVEFGTVSGGPAGTTFLYSADPPASISRDPQVSEAANTWCSAPSGGTAVFGSGTCPTGPATVTAVYADLGTLPLGAEETVTLGLLTDGNTCDDHYTNTFGARTDDLLLPIRSNDVTLMVGFCDPGIDIEKDTNGSDADTPSGPAIAIGDPITWTYVVENTGGTAIVDATVTDSQGVTVSCDIDGDGIVDGTNVIPFLAHGASVTCEGTGIADTTGQYSNNATVEGTGAVPDPATCGCDISDPSTWPTDPDDYVTPTNAVTGEPDFPLEAEDPSHYYGYVAEPGVDIEKDTNGDQADTPSGPMLAPGDPVTWTYVIENTGTLPLIPATVTDSEGVTVVCEPSLGDAGGDNIIDILMPGETVTCTGTGVATDGQYSNTATVSGPAFTPPAGCACDPTDPTTWPTDPSVYPPLLDDDGNPVTVDDEDDSHYFGADAAIDIEKDTNGSQADTPSGPAIPVGDPVTWTYEVANIGNTALLDATVTDNQGVTIDCDVNGDGVLDGTNIIPFLAPGDSITCEGTGTATNGQYSNNASVSGAPALPDPATCGCDLDDPSTWPTDASDFGPIIGEDGEPFGPVDDNDDSHYFGAEPGIDIEKDTNGVQADTPVGPFIELDGPVTWTYQVLNTGNTGLANATVSDDQGVVVDCDVDGDGVLDGTNIIPFLAPGDSVTCEGTGTAISGQYENNSSVTGDPVMPDPDTCGCDLADPSTWPDASTDPDAYGPLLGSDGTPVDPVTDEDPSHYFGVDPSVDIEKSTNGFDADTPTGPQIPVGDPVTWTYVVTNDGNTALANAEVNDDQGVVVDCDVDGDGVLDGTNVIPFLAPGDSVTCEGTGVSTGGQYTNNASVSGDPVLPDPDTCGCDLSDPSTWPTDPADYVAPVGPNGETFAPVTDDDDSYFFGTGPGIDIEKSTNGVDADTPVGPQIPVDGPVTWTYVVTNTGNTVMANATVSDDQGVTVSCDIDGDGVFDGTNVIPLMQPGASVTCEGSGTAVGGQYTNNASVTGDPLIPDPASCGCDPFDPATWPDDPDAYTPMVDESGNPVGPLTDEDPSHYFGVDPAVDIEKSTNGADADVAPGPAIDPGDTITWTYVVTNTGNVPLADATVSDDQGVVVSCDVDGDGVMDGTNVIPFLAIGASVTCEGTGSAEVGQYENNGSVSGTPLVPDPATCGCDPFDPSTWPVDPAVFNPVVGPDGNPIAPVTDTDPSHYHGNGPGIDLEKSTNGVDSDEAPGEDIAAGSPVTWTYVVTNTGDTPIANATVTDSQGVAISCDLDGDGTMEGSNVIPLLLPGDSVTCEGTGIAIAGPYTNDSSVSGDLVLPDPATCGCDINDPSTWPTDPSLYTPLLGLDGLPVPGVSDADPSNYTGVLASISGTLWHDADEDGILAPGEETFEGILVELLDADGNPVLDEDGNPIVTYTDAEGNYFFDVPPGDYSLRFTPPEGFRMTLGAGGDNDADPNTLTTGVISVGPGEHVPDIDAGFLVEVPPTLAFTGADSRTMLLIALAFITLGTGFILVNPLGRRRRPVVVVD